MTSAIPTIATEGPVLVFGGPYSNRQATAALLAEADRRAIPPDCVICTGDLVGFGADASETVALVRAAGIHVVQGHCEEALASGADKCGSGFTEGSACDRLAAAWFAHADRTIGAVDRAWLATLPRRIDIAIGRHRLAVVHATPASGNEFVFASTHAERKARLLDGLDADGVITGHSGLPFSQAVNGRLWLNAGAIGLPANDGTPRGWYAVLSLDGDRLVIEHCPLVYDHVAAAQAIRAAGLPEGCAAALATGLWPSCDMLPFEEVRQRGLPLEEGRVTWAGRGARPRRGVTEARQLWPREGRSNVPRLAPEKFRDPLTTDKGEVRATVALAGLKTLWINTGTLCNIACRNCYIESSPRNDRLAYISRDEVAAYLDEIERDGLGTTEIGFTGGEPFLNPEFPAILEETLGRGFRALVLTNAMRPMHRHKARLLALKARHGERLAIRVSLDHHMAARHEDERGPGTFQPTLDGLVWLARHGFAIAVAGRTMWGETEAEERAGYDRLFRVHDIPVDAFDRSQLVLFPEMDIGADVPEITTACWAILHKSPEDVMCASSRMVVKRKGAERPTVLACTLVPYDPAFELGTTLAEAARPVALNHPHCARFCVLGGASCSA